VTTLAISGLDAARIMTWLDGPDETAWVLVARQSVGDF
jgi:hypothetical protein